MIYFGQHENNMLKRMADVMSDHMSQGESDGYGYVYSAEYTGDDEATVNRLSELKGPALVITGEYLNMADCQYLFRKIVRSELDNWVPDASQRLLSRAAMALGFTEVATGMLISPLPDCSLNEANPDHVWVLASVLGVNCVQCENCRRLSWTGGPKHPKKGL